MGKEEKEVKVLDVDILTLKRRLDQLGAKKVEESIQQIYVYDLPSMYSRFYDCLLQLKDCEREYEYGVCRDKLKAVLVEVDNLMSDEELEKQKSLTGADSLTEFLNSMEDKEMLQKFSNIDIVEIIKKYGINPNKWVRLRKTNDNVTITIKHILNSSLKSNQQNGIQKVIETEVAVSSLEQGNDMLEQLGFAFRNYQEKKRVSYKLGDVEVDIDSWPLIPTYAEIEGETEEQIADTVEKLGLGDKEQVSCNTADVYKRYGIDLYQFRELRFSKENEKGSRC